MPINVPSPPSSSTSSSMWKIETLESLIKVDARISEEVAGTELRLWNRKFLNSPSASNVSGLDLVFRLRFRRRLHFHLRFTAISVVKAASLPHAFLAGSFKKFTII
ncbi:hypothetical protein L1887_35934 [Cichorium endivia]|nr:hypothetical protein L1887_35934 [Cichorium endivia]